VVAAAMLAAAMRTCSAALNSTATLVAYDLFKRHNPAIADHKLVTMGKNNIGGGDGPGDFVFAAFRPLHDDI